MAARVGTWISIFIIQAIFLCIFTLEIRQMINFDSQLLFDALMAWCTHHLGINIKIPVFGNHCLSNQWNNELEISFLTSLAARWRHLCPIFHWPFLAFLFNRIYSNFAQCFKAIKATILSFKTFAGLFQKARKNDLVKKIVHQILCYGHKITI